MRNLRVLSVALASFVAIAFVNDARSQQAPASPAIVRIGARLNNGQPALRGFVDMHTHPMSHLGFGGKVVHGAPDVDVMMLTATINEGSGCNGAMRRARTKEEALGSCMATHGGWDAFKNTCGDMIRHSLVKELEKNKHSDHGPDGFTAGRWPRFDDVTHQQMWIDWVRRAHAGGLRVMVALAVNNATLASVLKGAAPQDDKASGDLQIAEMKRMVSRNPWMEIAYSARDLRRIVGQDKLAVVLGVELDDMGNFNGLMRTKPDALTDGVIADEIRRLQGLGVRYMFPVHLTDNAFGGTATYIDMFNVANRNQWGRWWDLECAPPEQGLRWKHKPPREFLETVLATTSFGIPPTEGAPLPSCAAGTGHRNRRGLLRRGKVALQQMMRSGMIIDIDHGSRRMNDAVLAYTGPPVSYPVVSGHNGLGFPGQPELSENTRRADDYKTIAARGGMAGVGWGDRTAAGFLKGVRDVLGPMQGRAVALGTDINGLEPTPGGPCDPAWGRKNKLPECKETATPGSGLVRPPIVYSDATFPIARMGNKTWDYNTQGVAHYGLLPDFLKHAEQVQRADSIDGREVETLFDGAEAFAAMWERIERIAPTVPAAPVPKTALAGDCDSSQECQSGRCDVGSGSMGTSLCVPASGAGAAGDFCTHASQCASKSCTGDRCTAPAPQGLGKDCDASSVCASGRCDIGPGTQNTKRCIPRDGTGNTDDHCSHANQCKSRRCSNGRCQK